MTRNELLLFGERLRTRRGAMGLTQELVSEQAGISLRFYQMLERGEKSVSLDTLIRLSRTLDVSMDYLLLGETARGLEDPFSQLLRALPPRRREDALQILRLYAEGCGV